MRWLLWAKINGEWKYLGDYEFDSRERDNVHMLAIINGDHSMCLYIPSLSNGNQ